MGEIWIGFDPEIKSGVVAVCVFIVTWVFARLFLPKARLQYAHAHGFNYLVRNQGQPHDSESDVPVDDASTADSGESQPNSVPAYSSTSVQTAMYWVQNVGREAAKDVEIIFNYRPQHYELWPSIAYGEDCNPDQRFILRIGMLRPREWVTVNLLAAGALPSLMNVRSSNGESKLVRMVPTRAFPMWFLRLIQLLIVTGAFAIFFMLIRLLVF